MTTKDRGLTAYFIACVAITVGLLVPAVANIQAASAHQPYGGCEEAAAAPRSAGAKHCRQHGWFVRKRVVVSPRGWVHFNRLPACKYEDSRGCYWNAREVGNRKGHSYVIVPRKGGGTVTRYVRARSL